FGVVAECCSGQIDTIDGVVARVGVGLLSLVDERVDSEELPRLGVVVAVYAVRRPRTRGFACTRTKISLKVRVPPPPGLARGLRGVYVLVVRRPRPPPRRRRFLGTMRHRPTGRVLVRRLISSRNEGSAVRIRASALKIRPRCRRT